MISKISTLDEYKSQYEAAIQDPEGFWANLASPFTWKKKWTRVLDWSFDPFSVKWFGDGELNITENCLDRHLGTRGDQVAFFWETNDPNEQGEKITYRQLYHRVCRFGNMLRSLGVKKGDRVCLYMPMTPDLAIATLACARIGAIHSVVFAGFSAKSLSDRINDATCSILITADGAFRGNKKVALKSIVDEALATCPTIRKVVVQQRTRDTVSMKDGRDIWLHDALEGQPDECEAETMGAEDMLFILYTSGSTGKPKGVVHTCGGYMVFAEYSFRNVFQYEEGQVYWCTADVGWITGHTYMVYGPLLAGATSVLFEGIPTWPDAGRFWQVVDKYKVNIFYTAPTAIRALEACGTQFVEPYDLSSLKVLGTVGEPINQEAWEWYHHHIGKEKCPIVDTWWQTETGGILISPLAGITPLKPSFATLPLPGIRPVIVDNEGQELSGNSVEGNLCMAFPWPGMIRTTYGDHDRCITNYFSTYQGKYFTGDGCRRDEDGYYRITGRVDDVINVSGHRLGTAEIENAINENEFVVESAVVGYPHDIKGQGIYAYVICAQKPENEEAVRKDIIAKVNEIIGPIAKPDKIQFVSGLPKTRSGKIMRRILRKVAEGSDALGDTSTLLDPSVVDEIRQGALQPN
ncbi:MAG: acetate--CoA ligase [Flavobacteriales bacterium]|nr:acetate--CoA ligase [Flavobacteriales bacterium]